MKEDQEILRKKIWNAFPKSSYKRIPNYYGAVKAADNLRNTFEWLNSKIIFSSPDSAQIKVREYALLDGKTLIMATPKLKNGYLIIKPKDVKYLTNTAATIKGAFKFVESIKKIPKIDLIVEGSVAVDLTGGRLGKGGGFADQEISHLLKIKSITKDTLIVTLVHEIQIIDEVPIEAHDEKINMIVTPERIIRLKKKLNNSFRVK